MNGARNSSMDMVDWSLELDAQGIFESRYRAFLETITHLRPKLHRYCARMTGSVLDGEDVVQDALFQAYRKLETFADDRPLEPWLFRIAHNKCIDYLRARGVRLEAESEAETATPGFVSPVDPPGPALGRAVEHLVRLLPPKERACVLLKDVFDYSLEEIAELVDSTVGGVKAALARGRAKLADFPADAPAHARAGTPTPDELSRLLHLYVDGFNRRDWDGLRDLISADARLRVADCYAGRLDESGFFDRYNAWHDWQFTLGDVDGELIVVIDRRPTSDGKARVPAWASPAIQRLGLDETGRITRIADYSHCPWIVPAASSFHHT